MIVKNIIPITENINPGCVRSKLLLRERSAQIKHITKNVININMITTIDDGSLYKSSTNLSI